MKCCNKTITAQKGHSETKGDYWYMRCPECDNKAIGKTKAEVEKSFPAKEEKQKDRKNEVLDTYKYTMQSTELAPIPKDRKQLLQWSVSNMPALMNQSAQFIDKPATQRMIEKNIRYISNLSGKTWDKIWSSPEGQESISHALSEALYHAATLPDMGSIVPFGSTAEFVPSVECYKFGLETGKNAPFRDINIILIHENDQKKAKQENGNFILDLDYSFPRGEIIAVAVYATRTDTDKTVGEIYDVDRLLEKAKQHSPAYRNYLLEKEDFQRMRIEGKLKKDDSGREYIEKTIPKRDGGSFKKKIYEHDIVNPYDGPDRPEMLRKAAGKSFFRPYMRTRNASAMAEEWQDDETIQDEMSREKAADNVLNSASRQFSNIDSGAIVDAEIITEEHAENVNKTGGEKKDLNKKSGGNKNENDIKDL